MVVAFAVVGGCAVAYPLVELHVKLLRKLKKTVSFQRWEVAAARFAAASRTPADGVEIERRGYAQCPSDLKLRLLVNRLGVLPLFLGRGLPSMAQVHFALLPSLTGFLT